MSKSSKSSKSSKAGKAGKAGKNRKKPPVRARRAAPATPVQVRRPPAPEDEPLEQRTGGGWTGVREIGGDAWRARVEDAVVVLVNERRRRAGLAPLTVDERLRTAARRHSAAMAAQGFFAHVAPDGSTPAQRMRAAGHPQPAAENLAKGQRTAHEVVHAWWNSPGHRKNLLLPEIRTIGVGVRHGAPDGPWWTQNFGYPA
ncbi:CAP domain-containing protein [Streptomyces sp. NPDC058548]|uniref:CAP domain-containing protein n=1 Tax=unclassified Streptomyces TaxID=2593676 RepID=UPI00365DFA42